MNKKFKSMFLTGFYHNDYKEFKFNKININKNKYNKKDNKMFKTFNKNIKEKITNFLAQRFLKNKIFKTLLKRRHYRFNEFVLKFIKFFYVKSFNKVRGFMNIFSSNCIKISYLNSLSLSYCSKLFIKNLFNPLLICNDYIYKINIKTNPFIKYEFLKKNLKINIKKIINNNYINNIIFSLDNNYFNYS